MTAAVRPSFRKIQMSSYGLAILPPSRRFRMHVHFAALLLLFLSLAQSMHHHGFPAVGAKARVDGTHRTLEASSPADSELTCPLCISSHLVLPSCADAIGRLMFFGRAVFRTRETAAPYRFWSFPLFSRPPPQD
jgi:hypothetical protein